MKIKNKIENGLSWIGADQEGLAQLRSFYFSAQSLSSPLHRCTLKSIKCGVNCISKPSAPFFFFIFFGLLFIYFSLKWCFYWNTLSLQVL